MPLSNYTELQAEIADWLDRADLTAKIPTFITLAETKINRTLRIQSMEVLDESFIIDSGTETLPTGFRAAKRFYIDASPRRDLKYLPSSRLNSTDLAANAAGQPFYFTYEAGSFRFRPEPNSAFTAVLLYWKAIDGLDVTPTNDLLTNSPDVYLYGALAEAAAFLVDSELLATYVALFNQAMQAVQAEDDLNRVSGSELTPRARGSTP